MILRRGNTSLKGRGRCPSPRIIYTLALIQAWRLQRLLQGCTARPVCASIANEVVIILNGYLPRVLAFYVRIMHSPQFDRVDTLVCAPSRMAAYVPVFEGMKRRGVQNVEYQALFWSGHPRYEVRDMNLFCLLG